MELKDDGITYGEYDDNGTKKIAVFKNGEVLKNTDRTLVDPKTYTADYFKNKNWIAEPAQAAPANPKKTLDVATPGGPKPVFDSQSAYKQALSASGGVWNEKAQAVYTDIQLASA